MRRRETLRWRWKPGRATVRWRRAARMLGPLLGRGRSTPGTNTRLRGVCWYLGKNQHGESTSAKSERDGDGVVAPGGGLRGQVGEDGESSRAPAGGRTRGDIGLGGCAGNITREGLAVPPKPPPNSVSAVFPKLPHEDSRRARGDIEAIASGRSKLLQVIAAVGWSSMYLFRFCP